MKAVSGDARKTNAINYAGGGEQIASIIGGHVTVGVGGIPEFASQVESGKLRPLAVTSAERMEGLDVPTLKEQGVDVAYGTWRGMMGSEGFRSREKGIGRRNCKDGQTQAWKDSLKRYGWIGSYEGPRRVLDLPERAGSHDEDRIGGSRPPEVTNAFWRMGGHHVITDPVHRPLISGASHATSDAQQAIRARLPSGTLREGGRVRRRCALVRPRGRGRQGSQGRSTGCGRHLPAEPANG